MVALSTAAKDSRALCPYPCAVQAGECPVRKRQLGVRIRHLRQARNRT